MFAGTNSYEKKERSFSRTQKKRKGEKGDGEGIDFPNKRRKHKKRNTQLNQILKKKRR